MPVRRLGVVPVALAVLGLLAHTLTASPVSGQFIRGQVIDSVSGNPIAGATVVLLDSTGLPLHEVRADPAGLFLIRPTTPGSFRLSASSPEHTASSFPSFSLARDDSQNFMLLLPSSDVAEQVRRLRNPCPPSSNRGHLVGWVRRGDNRVPIPGITIRVRWTDLPDFLADAVGGGDFVGESQADETGRYVVCGIPLGHRVWIHAFNDSVSSDFFNLQFEDGIASVGAAKIELEGQVLRLDLPTKPVDLHVSSVRGMVTSEAGAPIAGVTVEIAGTNYVTETGSDGGFELSGLPPGPARLVARRVGNLRVEQEVQIPAGRQLVIPSGILVMEAGVELDPVIVEALPPHDALAEFKHRKSLGQGSFITRDEFMSQGVPATAIDVLRRMHGIRIYPGPDFERRWIIMMQRGGARTFGAARTYDPEFEGSSPCPPLVFLDRHYLGNVNNFGLERAIPLETVEAVEAHQSVATLPNEFNRPGANCGVIAFWTRFAEPRPVPVEEGEKDRGFWSSTGFHVGVAAAAVIGILIAVGKAIHF